MQSSVNRVKVLFRGRDCPCCDQWVVRAFGSAITKEDARWSHRQPRKRVARREAAPVRRKEGE